MNAAQLMFTDISLHEAAECVVTFIKLHIYLKK